MKICYLRNITKLFCTAYQIHHSEGKKMDADIIEALIAKYVNGKKADMGSVFSGDARIDHCYYKNPYIDMDTMEAEEYKNSLPNHGAHVMLLLVHCMATAVRDTDSIKSQM